MESLFDLIFENFWVLLILFGIVSSLFGGDKKKQKQKPYSETTQMPTMTPTILTESKKVLQRQNDEKKVKEIAAAVIPENTQQVKEELPTAYNYLTEKQAKLQRQSEPMRKKTPDLQVQKVDEKATRGTFSQDEVVNGLIMAEILGPPRAKKPHARSRR